MASGNARHIRVQMQTDMSVPQTHAVTCHTLSGLQDLDGWKLSTWKISLQLWAERKRIAPHLSATSMWTNFCSCLNSDVKILSVWDNSVHVTSPNTRNYTYTGMQIRFTDLQLNNSICQCLIFYPYPLLTLFFPCFCSGCCCCFEPWWTWSCGEESDVWSGLDLCSAVAVAEAVLLAPRQAGRPLQPGPSSSMGGSKSDKEAQSLRVCACVCASGSVERPWRAQRKGLILTAQTHGTSCCPLPVLSLRHSLSCSVG